MHVTGPKRFSKNEEEPLPGASQEQANGDGGRRRTWAQYDSPGVGYCIPDPPPPLEGSIHYSKYTLLRKIEGLFQEGGGWRV